MKLAIYRVGVVLFIAVLFPRAAPAFAVKGIIQSPLSGLLWSFLSKHGRETSRAK
jgi:hypothetical protein